MLPLGHPKSAFHVSGNRWMVSQPVGPRSHSFSVRVTRCPSLMVLGGRLFLLDATVVTVGHFVPLVAWGDHWDRRDAFLSAGDSQYPILWQVG